MSLFSSEYGETFLIFFRVLNTWKLEYKPRKLKHLKFLPQSLLLPFYKSSSSFFICFPKSLKNNLFFISPIYKIYTVHFTFSTPAQNFLYFLISEFKINPFLYHGANFFCFQYSSNFFTAFEFKIFKVLTFYAFLFFQKSKTPYNNWTSKHFYFPESLTKNSLFEKIREELNIVIVLL